MTALITATFLILTASALAALNSTRTPHDATRLELQPSTTRIAEQQTAVWNCQDQLGQPRTPVSVPPWKLPRSTAYRAFVLRLWTQRRQACALTLRIRESALREQRRQWNYTLWMPQHWINLAACESGSSPPDWKHDSGTYQGGFGFWYGSWDSFNASGDPDNAADATPWQQWRAALRIAARYGLAEPWGCWRGPQHAWVRNGLPEYGTRR